MNSPILFAKLAEIKEARLLASEAVAALAPFIGKPFSLSLTFLSVSRTFGHRFDSAYDDGQTLVCKLGDGEIEAAVLLVPEENDLADSLAPDEVFEARLTVLDFDTLHQRPVLGQYLGDIPVPAQDQEEETEEDAPEQPEETPAVEYHEAVEITENEEAYQPEPEPIVTRDPSPSAVSAILDDMAQANRKREKRSPRKRSAPPPVSSSQAKPPEEKKGCGQGCRFIIGAFLLLFSLGSCSNGNIGGGFVLFLFGLGCFWPIIKKKIDEQQS